jgi:hypothetical protein
MDNSLCSDLMQSCYYSFKQPVSNGYSKRFHTFSAHSLMKGSKNNKNWFTKDITKELDSDDNDSQDAFESYINSARITSCDPIAYWTVELNGQNATLARMALDFVCIRYVLAAFG